jgi:hypothetical protein
MGNRTTLFEFQRDSVHIIIEARFEYEDLIIGGNFKWEKIEKLKDDSEYESTIIIRAKNLAKFREVLNLSEFEKYNLLLPLAIKFHGNTSFSDILQSLQENNIEHEFVTCN